MEKLNKDANIRKALLEAAALMRRAGLADHSQKIWKCEEALETIDARRVGGEARDASFLFSCDPADAMSAVLLSRASYAAGVIFRASMPIHYGEQELTEEIGREDV